MIKKIFKSELGKGSLILLITMNLYNFLNFLFHFSMGRILSPEDYGTLAVLMSLVYIYGIPSEAIQNIISKYTSRFNVERNIGKIKYLIIRSFSKGFIICFILLFILEIFAIFLSFYLKINYWLIFITNLLIVFSILSPIIKGVLQGRKKFSLLGTGMIIESGLKLVLSIFFVLLGFGVFGAMGGILMGISLSFIILVYFNKDIIKNKKQETSFENIYSKSIPYFITIFAIFVIFSIDIILAKRFFSPDIAGKYAVLSMLGKMIFFGTFAISKAIFPITSEKYEKNQDLNKIIKKSILFTSVLCLIAVLIYGIFPEIIIKLLYGNQYIDIKNYLVYSGITFSFLSLSNLILTYGLSTNKLKKTYYLIAILLIDFVLLSLFHSTILEYMITFMIVSIIIFISSIFLIKNGNKRENKYYNPRI